MTRRHFQLRRGFAGPRFEPLEPRWLLSSTDPTIVTVVACPDTAVTGVSSAAPVSGESSKSWTWSGSTAIPDGPDGAWVGQDFLAPGVIPTGATVTHVSIHQVITHPYVGDLQVELYDSTHTWYVRTNEGGSAHDIDETRTNFGTFAGDSPMQDWHFRVRDTVALSTGTLDALELTVYYSVTSNNPPTISGLPDISLNENGTYPSSGASADAKTNAAKLGWDGDTSTFAGTGGPLGDATPAGTMFRSDLEFGGQWWDANKTVSNTQDDLMCWAAAASNMLEWTGWGDVNGLASAQDIFLYLQGHWTDQGGMMEYGWDWWFAGTNPSQGWYGWSQVDVPGGGFWPTSPIASYYHSQEDPALAMTAIDQWCRAGYGVTLGIYGPGAHAITCWGFNVNPSNPTDYYGVWITDSDDDKSSNTPPDRLRYYEVKLSGGEWCLQNYYGSNAWSIGEVEALDRKAGVAPPPPAEVDLWQYASDDQTPASQLYYSIVAVTNPSCGVAISGNRTITVNPAHNWSGVSYVTVQVSDGQYSATDTFRITVNPVNQPPTISGLPDQTLVKGTTRPYAIYLPGYASDPETPGAALTYTIVGNTNSSCGAKIVSRLYISMSPSSSWTGWSDVTVQVSDGQYTATDVFRVTVANPTVDLSGALAPIVVVNPAGPASFQLVQLQVRNSGTATASSLSTMQLWASADGVPGGADDFKLSEIRPYVYLPAGAAGYYYFAYLVPGNVPAGTYDLVAVIDSSNNFSESVETNNQASIASGLVMRNPDLTIGIPFASLPSTARGSWGWALLRVDNAGPAWAYGQADIQVWASTDGVLGNGAGDVLLTTLSNYWIVLPPGAAGYYAAVFQLPQSMASGSYSIMAVVNSSDTLAETDLTNNTATWSTVYPVTGAGPLQGAGTTHATPAPAQGLGSASPAGPSVTFPSTTPRTHAAARGDAPGSGFFVAPASPVAAASMRSLIAGHAGRTRGIFDSLDGLNPLDRS